MKQKFLFLLASFWACTNIDLAFGQWVQNKGLNLSWPVSNPQAGIRSSWHSTRWIAVSATQDGSMDSGFATQGFASIPINGGNGYDICNSIALQADGKIVAAGSDAVSNPHFAVARLKSDGTLDNSFGTSGTVLVSSFVGAGNSVAIQSDGKIVVGGASNGEFALVRINIDGTLDTAFGQKGLARTYIGGDSSLTGGCSSIAIQPDGKILAGGTNGHGFWESESYVYHSSFALARFNTDGTLDGSFGTSGTTSTYLGDVDGYHGQGNSVAIQSDGKIDVGCTLNSYFAVVRFLSDGELDEAFGSNGYALASINGRDTYYDECRSIAIQSDGKIVGAGDSQDNSYRIAFSMVRFNTSGTIDSTFGPNGNGTTRAFINGGVWNDFCYSVVIRPDGKIITGGESLGSAGSYGDLDAFALAQFNSDGVIDSGFGTSGSIRAFRTDTNGTTDQCYSILVQSDGKIIAGGTRGDWNNNVSFAIERFVESPLSVGGSGSVTKSFALYQNYPNPFNPSTVINYQLLTDAYVTLSVYDILGREVTTLVNGYQYSGTHFARFNGINLPSGVYLYRLQVGNWSATRKMVLIK